MSAVSPPTTGHLTTPLTPHWPAHVSDSRPSDNMIKWRQNLIVVYIYLFAPLFSASLQPVTVSQSLQMVPARIWPVAVSANQITPGRTATPAPAASSTSLTVTVSYRNRNTCNRKCLGSGLTSFLLSTSHPHLSHQQQQRRGKTSRRDHQ